MTIATITIDDERGGCVTLNVDTLDQTLARLRNWTPEETSRSELIGKLATMYAGRLLKMPTEDLQRQVLEAMIRPRV